ncbi:MAG TPA: SNF2 helicase-associated domain-containing protein, partial [Tepidisphaeraceae bacterium]|nr:SNF2 helicase-associated domain-containing protein [Tepidisphaeraceae bacterium]
MIWSPAADAPAEGQTARLRDAVGQLVSEPLLATVATDATVTVRPNGDGGTRVAIPALAFSPAEAVDLLTGLPDDGHAAAVGDSVRYWRALARYVVDRVRRQRFYPSAVRSGDEVLAVWRVPVAGHDEAARLEHFATAIPPVCLASCPGGIEPLTLVQSFVAEAADALVRRATSNDPFFARACSGPRAPESVPEVRWLRALLAPGRAVAGDLFENAALVDHVVRWTAPLDESGVGRSWRVALRLTEPEIPEVDEVVFRGAWRVEIELHPAEDDPLAPTAAADEDAELLTAADVWAGLRGRLGLFSRDVAAARTTLASGLRQAAGAVPPLAAAMAATPELTYLDLTTEDAYKFIRQWSPQLREFGLVVIVPEWAAEPEIRPGLVMSLRPVGLDEADEMGLHVVGGTGGDGRGPGDRFAVPGAMGLDSLVHFDWRVAVAGTEMSAAEFESLVSRQSPLVRRNGKWAVIDLEAATATAEALKREAAEAQQAITLGEAFRTAFGMSRAVDGRAPIVGLSGSGWLRDLLEQTPAARMAAVPQPAEFTGELRPYQLRGLGWLSFLDRLGIGGCLADDMGLGKAQPLDAKVLTPTGWTRMGDVQVGDRVVGSDGKPCRVTGVYPQGKRDVFRVTFSDGSGTECCDEHLWHVNTPVRRHRGLPGRVLPLAQIRQRLRDGTGNALHFVPLVQPVEFEPALTVPDGSRLPIAPYLLGALLGDGGIAHRVIISSADDDLLAHVVTLLPPGVTLKYTGHGVDYRIAGETPGRENPVTEALRRLEL